MRAAATVAAVVLGLMCPLSGARAQDRGAEAKGWRLKLISVRQAGAEFKVSARLQYVVIGRGFSSETPPGEMKTLWVGLTVRDAAGKPFDAPALELAAPKADQALEFSTKLQGKDFALGVWKKKVSPCADEAWGSQHGCKAYGYLLDESLITLPRYNYQGETRWAGFPAGTGPITVKVLSAGAPEEVVTAARKVVGDLLGEQFKPWGRTVSVVDGGKAANRRYSIEVMYRDPSEAARADQLAEELGVATWPAGYAVETSTRQWKEAAAPFVIAVGQK